MAGAEIVKASMELGREALSPFKQIGSGSGRPRRALSRRRSPSGNMLFYPTPALLVKVASQIPSYGKHIIHGAIG
jgi:hypothetical protein